MNARRQSRIAELDARIKALTDEAEIVSTSQTRRAVIATDIRQLLSERASVENSRDPVYDTVESHTLFNIVRAHLSKRAS